MGFLVKLVLVTIVLAGGLWGWNLAHPSQSAIQESVQAQTPSQAQEKSQGSINTSIQTDASLSSDLRAFDSEVESAQSASADAETFNDQPVQQTE